MAIIAEIAHATGTIDGMIGGQVMDLEAEHTASRRADAGVHSSLEDGSPADGQRGQRRHLCRRRRSADPEACATSARTSGWPFRSSMMCST